MTFQHYEDSDFKNNIIDNPFLRNLSYRDFYRQINIFCTPVKSQINLLNVLFGDYVDLLNVWETVYFLTYIS